MTVRTLPRHRCYVEFNAETGTGAFVSDGSRYPFTVTKTVRWENGRKWDNPATKEWNQRVASCVKNGAIDHYIFATRDLRYGFESYITIVNDRSKRVKKQTIHFFVTREGPYSEASSDYESWDDGYDDDDGWDAGSVGGGDDDWNWFGDEDVQ